MARQKAHEERQQGELNENVVKIKRCAAVVKGGRRFSFAAMVVVGDGHGKVGWGYGKANEVPPSVEKARKEAMRNMIAVPMDGSHDSAPGEGRYGAAQVVLVPASSRYRRDRRRGGASGLRSGRHSRHPHQELRLEQSGVAGQGDDCRLSSNCGPARKSNDFEE